MGRAADEHHAPSHQLTGSASAAAERNSITAPLLAISVIVPAYNAPHYLERSLPPLIAMRDRGEIAEVLVVDDCSTDRTCRDVAEGLGARLIVMERNRGPGAARNRAALAATGEVLWFVDADVVVHRGSGAAIAAALEDQSIWALFGSYDRNPPATNFASQYKNLVHRYYHQRGRAEASTFWAGCGAVRASAFWPWAGSTTQPTVALPLKTSSWGGGCVPLAAESA